MCPKPLSPPFWLCPRPPQLTSILSVALLPGGFSPCSVPLTELKVGFDHPGDLFQPEGPWESCSLRDARLCAWMSSPGAERGSSSCPCHSRGLRVPQEPLLVSPLPVLPFQPCSASTTLEEANVPLFSVSLWIRALTLVCFPSSSTNWTAIPSGRNSWTTSSSSCRRGVSDVCVSSTSEAGAGWIHSPCKPSPQSSPVGAATGSSGHLQLPAGKSAPCCSGVSFPFPVNY